MKNITISLQILLLAVLFPVLTAYCSQAKVNSIPLEKIQGPIVVAEAPTNEAVVVKLPDGELKIFYIATSKDKVESISSKDNGLTWANPKVEFKLPGKAYYAIHLSCWICQYFWHRPEDDSGHTNHLSGDIP